jgi:hypothetical protein
MAYEERLEYPLNHNKQEAVNFVLEQVAGNHGILTAASIWLDTAADRIKWIESDGSTIHEIPLPSEGGGDADTLGGQSSAYHLSRANHTGTQTAATISDFATAVAALTIDAETLEGESLADVLDRANHTGTQLAATISNLAGTVQAYRLDQFAAPNTDLSAGSQKIINLTAGTANGHAVNVGQLNSAVAGLASTGYVDSAVAGIFDGVDEAYDTIQEIVAQLQEDETGLTALTTAVNARARKFTAAIGNGSLTEIDVVHNFGNRNNMWQVNEAATPWGVIRPGSGQVDANTLRLKFTTAPTTNQYVVQLTTQG